MAQFHMFSFLVDQALARVLQSSMRQASLHFNSLLACGSQAFIATLLFDPSMSALPIIETQKSQSVGLFTRQ